MAFLLYTKLVGTAETCVALYQSYELCTVYLTTYREDICLTDMCLGGGAVGQEFELEQHTNHSMNETVNRLQQQQQQHQHQQEQAFGSSLSHPLAPSSPNRHSVPSCVLFEFNGENDGAREFLQSFTTCGSMISCLHALAYLATASATEGGASAADLETSGRGP